MEPFANLGRAKEAPSGRKTRRFVQDSQVSRDALDRLLIERVPGAKNQPHDRIRGGHFIQEDPGPELAERMIVWVERPTS
jgi:hypothetical protein